jgi:hypothetical protein
MLIDEAAFRDHEINGKRLLYMAKLTKSDTKQVLLTMLETKFKVFVVGHQLEFLELLEKML